MKLADQAIAIEPGEALFYGMKGDALDRLKRYPQARKAYDKAVALNPDYFLHHLKRGVLESKQGDEGAARRDLQRSLELLPTADAHFLLGRILEQQGQTQVALKHFKTVAESDSAMSKRAWAEVARLDLADNPGRYLKISLRRNSNGRLLVQISNPTPLAVRDLVLLIGMKNPTGSIPRGRNVRLRGSIEPGKAAVFKTPVRGIESDRKLARYGASIISAEVVR